MAYFRSMASTRHPARTCSALSEATRSRTRVGYCRSTPSLISVESPAPTPSALLASTSLRTHGRPRLHPEESSRRLQSGLHHPLLHLRRCGHIRPPSPLNRLLLRRAWHLRSSKKLTLLRTSARCFASSEVLKACAFKTTAGCSAA